MGAYAVLDDVLDLLVVPGYSAIGPGLRKRWWPADAAHFDGKLDIVVTGGSSGIGEAAASSLAALGARIHLVGRKAGRLEDSAGRIRKAVPAADLVVHEADISDLDAVRSLAADLDGSVDSVRALIHCAGLIPPERALSAQGHEMALATHVLGPFLLTHLLRARMRADGDARVIWVSSGGMYSSPLVRDLEFTDGPYKGIRAYARTKRMQVTMAELLGERWPDDRDPVVHSMHPGWAATPGVTGSIATFAKVTRPILRTPEQGADTIVWLAAAAGPTGPSATTGQFWHDRRVRPTYYLRWQHDDPAARAHLWERCQLLV
ncbi:NAD(P)-dependent dehydrogenase (short-subunit alcohol dehydrogenase family) [Nakamurella sp. UYEF19]|uniref:SDR family NAD(P)-dependent oxidoreductase n=1 Tax=Nakamurella sp. UYEF19 TaxID=1756392 RepID=UPI0033936A41